MLQMLDLNKVLHIVILVAIQYGKRYQKVILHGTQQMQMVIKTTMVLKFFNQ